MGGPSSAGPLWSRPAVQTNSGREVEIAAMADNIYTREDAEFLTRSGALAGRAHLGVETGGCRAAIREDAAIDLAAIDGWARAHPKLDLMLVESGGDNSPPPSAPRSPTSRST